MQDPQQQAAAAGEVVVLTGSSGCLGHRTLRLLISDDDAVREIRCLDLVEASESMKRSINEEVKKLAEREPRAPEKSIQFVTGDVRDINVVERTLAGADCVLHCASRVDVWTAPGEQDALELESVNVAGTENLLKACIRLGVPKFVHVSSFETFVNYHTIYYATESTLPDPKWLLFGPSADSKKAAELKVRLYANNKLKQPSVSGRDSLNAIIVRFTPIYGEHDKHYVSKVLKVAKMFGGKLQRFTNVWIRQQPIYVGNAAWSLLKANRRMDVDETISGEEFHVTDDTRIGDPFDFLEPFVECRGMHITKSTLPAWPVWFLLIMFSYLRSFLGLFRGKPSRLDEAKQATASSKQQLAPSPEPKWYHLVTPQTFFFMCNSLFLNRTKASLRLDYEPRFGPEDSLKMSIDWYRDGLEV